MPDDLFAAQTSELANCEARIEQAERDGYLVRGRELAAIRDEELYRGRYQTFEAYCDERWEMDRSRAYRLIDAARFVDRALSPIGDDVPHPIRESHIRPLFKLDADEDRLTVWQDALGNKRPRDVKATDVQNAVDRFLISKKKDYFTIDEWNGLPLDAQLSLLEMAGNEGLNRQTNADIEWANWSWNPITGCLHDCPYCYARDIAFNIYPGEVAFRPTLWPKRLNAPIDRAPPGEGADKNIFVCSMADLFGRWVPAEWIEAVMQTVENSPQWNFLFLTKFPKRMSEFQIPVNAWLGTTVDLQARVANAEKAFAAVKAPVRWLSLEPMLEPLKFSCLDMFDWVVIGGASESRAIGGTPSTPSWSVPIDWITNVHRQAREAGCAVYYKTNSGLTGTTRLREYPGAARTVASAPAVFDYLRALPKGDQTG